MLPNNLQPMERVLVSVVLFVCLVLVFLGKNARRPVAKGHFLYVAPEIVSKGLDEDPGSAKSIVC